jgi:hypothetical protein
MFFCMNFLVCVCRICEKSEAYKAYAKEQHQEKFWCSHCDVLSLQLWHSSSPANLASAFPLGKAWPASWFFFECDGGCPNSDFSLRTVKVPVVVVALNSAQVVFVQSIVELKQTGFVPYFCFDCRAFTKQARLIHTITQQAPFLTMNGIEPLMDCKFGCSKHDELKQLVSSSVLCSSVLTRECRRSRRTPSGASTGATSARSTPPTTALKRSTSRSGMALSLRALVAASATRTSTGAPSAE